MPEGPAPVDWQGEELDCGACKYSARRETGQCGLGWACVHDRYAKRIERFFVLNPELANECLGMPYFETRMNAARVANVFRLPVLLEDADAGVRAMAILRLPRSLAKRHIMDPDRRMRIAVTHRLETQDLLPMLSDSDSYVRSIAARRAEPGMLPVAISDVDPEIRRIIARRIGEEWLDRFRNDPDPLVRREAAERRPALFTEDPDLRVRHCVADTGDAETVAALLEDEDEFIRETAQARLAQLQEANHVHR